ncbi:response regulator transcription factor [Actinokineospora diospyrosa]|uniref:Response regulator receiver domain-containing protein n=1 Tax=Actinokineospora diospyrosa TaxID=103728 RepID=A0ABT1IQ41_9PSEU|nr:response regulator [Actinokineospora diospyrosa]MCP2274276.1 Response regulator receiver domain-containing protein [Actinokineospora diospyrosa]
MKRIVVAEDDPDLRDLLVFKLGQAGYEVTAVATGQEALDQAETAAAQLFLLDVTLPDMTGLQVCSALRAAEATRDTPVVLLTGRTQQSDIDAGRSSGASDYIFKPFSPRDLVGRIETLLAAAGESPGR